MRMAIHRIEDPALKTIELGAVYSTHAPRTGEPWVLYKVADECGVSSIEPLEVPDGWDDSYEYAMDDTDIWPYIALLAGDADLVHADLEIAIVTLVDDEMESESCALLHRFSYPY